MESNTEADVLWFIPEDKSQPFLDFFVLVKKNASWELKIIQNTTTKRHEKPSDTDQLCRVLRGLETAGFCLETKITVAYIVETLDESDLGNSMDGNKVHAPMNDKDNPEKEFQVSVIRALYTRSSRAGPS